MMRLQVALLVVGLVLVQLALANGDITSAVLEVSPAEGLGACTVMVDEIIFVWNVGSCERVYIYMYMYTCIYIYVCAVCITMTSDSGPAFVAGQSPGEHHLCFFPSLPQTCGG